MNEQQYRSIRLISREDVYVFGQAWAKRDIKITVQLFTDVTTRFDVKLFVYFKIINCIRDLVLFVEFFLSFEISVEHVCNRSVL